MFLWTTLHQQKMGAVARAWLAFRVLNLTNRISLFVRANIPNHELHQSYFVAPRLKDSAYSREVVGLTHKRWGLFHLNSSIASRTVENGCCCPCVFDISYVNTYTDGVSVQSTNTTPGSVWYTHVYSCVCVCVGWCVCVCGGGGGIFWRFLL